MNLSSIMHSPADAYQEPHAGGADSPSSEQPPVKRRRLRKACIPCRQRKRKCNYLLPCEMCTKHGYACSYDANPGSTGSLLERSAWPGSDALPSRQAPSSADSQSHHTPDPGSYRSLRSPTPDAIERGVLDPGKARFVSGSSIVAFPRILAEELQSKSLPSLHSFGWNFGVRPEENAERHDPLHKLVSQAELHRYGARYFNVLQPIFDVLDQQIFHRRCREYYNAPENHVLYGSIIAGVVALGSFFSGAQGHKRETDIVQYAKRILEDPLFTRHPTVDMVTSWVLRTIYLRGTTRPNNAWLSSATTMNLAEATGLHRDPKTVTIVNSDGNGSHNLDEDEQDRRRRVFWIAWLMNAMISYEYGRSAVALPFITCQQINRSSQGTFTHALIRIAQCIPTLASAPNGNTSALSPKRSLCAAIANLVEIPGMQHPFTALTRTDLALCFYRHLRNRQITIPEETVSQLIKIGHDTLEAASRLAKEQCLWWNVIGSIFQLVCVCISINNSASLALLGPAIRVLDDIVRIANTTLSREALMMARHLVEAATMKKKRELAMLEGAGASAVEGTFKNVGPAAVDADPINMDYVNFNVDQFFSDWNDLTGFGENPGFTGTQWVGHHTMPMLDPSAAFLT